MPLLKELRTSHADCLRTVAQNPCKEQHGTPPSRAHHTERAGFHLSADVQASVLEFRGLKSAFLWPELHKKKRSEAGIRQPRSCSIPPATC
jgi:hypothetical protein